MTPDAKPAPVVVFTFPKLCPCCNAPVLYVRQYGKPTWDCRLGNKES